MIRHYLQRMYGDDLEVEYRDAALPETLEAAGDLLAQVEGRYPYYPLVFLNGELVIEGSAEFYHVLRAVQQVAPPPDARQERAS